jgi:hypothetical protein
MKTTLGERTRPAPWEESGLRSHAASKAEEATLSAELIGKANQALVAPVDRRSSDRRYLKRGPTVKCLAKPTFKPYIAVVQNFSTNGLGLLMRRRFEPGTTLAIQIGRIWSEWSSVVIAQVRHSSPLGRGRWLVGCHIRKGLSMDEIELLATERPIVRSARRR